MAKETCCVMEEHKDRPSCGCGNEHTHVSEGSNQNLMIRLVVAFALTIAAVLVKERVHFAVSLTLFLSAYALSGYEVLYSAFQNILKGKVFNENFLMSVATIGAFSIGEHAEGVAVMIFFGIGEYFESLAVNKSTQAISALADLRPDTLHLKMNGEIIDVSPSEANIGDIFLVYAGERIALDGVVSKGRAFIDTSAITGESVPVEAFEGRNVLSGGINTDGVIEVSVTAELEQSTVSRIINLVRDAKQNKPSTEGFITRFAAIYTPIVVFAAVALATIPPLFFDGEFPLWLHRALTFLVASCPCALVVSIPLSFYAGIGAAGSKGILVKGGNFLEALNKIDGVVFDKTGTLTSGILQIRKITPANEFASEDVLKLAAYAESFSSHPIAKAVVQAYGHEVDRTNTESFTEISGMGVSVIYQGKSILAGNEKLMATASVTVLAVVGTALHLSVDGIYAGSITFSEQTKTDAKLAIQNLKKMGIASMMFTGDSPSAAREVAQELGIDDYFAGMLPQDKLEKFQELGGSKIFVGDGINDAPVLANAAVGIAMGGLGRDAAVDAADVVIMNDQPGKVADAVRIAKQTAIVVRQNVSFVLAVKLAVFALVLLTQYTPMWVAVFADVGVALLTVLNATRIIFNAKRKAL